MEKKEIKKVVVINPILYTCETSNIKKVDSIKDSMIYNLCLEFKKNGIEPVLIAAKDYEPIKKEKYDFNIVFLETKMKKIFLPNCFPFLRKLTKTINEIKPDFIISGEVFSINSLIVSAKFKKNTIIWHELAKHNNIFKKIPSKIWYNIVCKIFFKDTRIVARSKNAQDFISKYCNNVSELYIDHGVDINKFMYNDQKEKKFIVVSQLIQRKHIDGIIREFSNFLANNKTKNYKLLIFGSGEEESKLKSLTKTLKIEKNVIFKGQQSHETIIPELAKSMALVINTERDNSMLSIVESIATGTPVLTTNVPFNVDYIKKYKLGVVTNKLACSDFNSIVENNENYVSNCINYRNKVSNEYHVKQFIEEMEKLF